MLHYKNNLNLPFVLKYWFFQRKKAEKDRKQLQRDAQNERKKEELDRRNEKNRIKMTLSTKKK